VRHLLLEEGRYQTESPKLDASALPAGKNIDCRMESFFKFAFLFKTNNRYGITALCLSIRKFDDHSFSAGKPQIGGDVDDAIQALQPRMDLFSL
jgi:hypothetical protein